MIDNAHPLVPETAGPRPSRDVAQDDPTPEPLLKRQLQRLHQVGHTLSLAGSFDELCQQAVVRGRQLLPYQRVSLWFREADSMTVTGSFGVDEQGQLRDERAQLMTVPHHSPLGQVLTHQHPLWMNEACSLYNEKGKRVGEGTLAIAALWNGPRVMGCLCMDNLLDQRPIHEADGELLKGYASTLSHLASRKRVEDELKKSLKEKEILLREVHHRVKNNLQLVSSLLNLQAAYVRDPHDAELFRQSQARLKSMAKVYEIFYRAKDFTRINMHDYCAEIIQDMFRSYSLEASAITLRLEGRAESLSLAQAIPCGLILHELVTHALKHGFNRGNTGGRPLNGEISLVIRRTDHHLSMALGHHGNPFPGDMDIHHPASLELQLVNALVAQLNGTLALDQKNGTVFTIAFPDAGEEASTVGEPLGLTGTL